MERLDQGHLHPKLEVPRLTCLGRESKLGTVVGGKHSGKELFEQRVNSYSRYLLMSPRQCYINHTPVVYSLTHTQLNFYPNIPPIPTLMQLRHTHGPILTFLGFHRSLYFLFDILLHNLTAKCFSA